ncbi:conserved hypothetical protein [Solidesulfovibrio fructosivorans JJ]]|uniref:Uncharacterized protein n=1 Tax=Solidesulfovibrio fructosivorans JJ] TaxID=596151 RepID=E1JSB7_SOLFR|nr:hypothetical protein [Solidesulfovibrio fructosivorans]EFL52886.1 conserved hypothetical protein [Solidesulfovibrio fructosivorans JJ]]
MDISTSYDSLTRLLQINSSTGSGATIDSGSASSTTTTCDSGASDTDTATWSAVAKALSGSESDYMSPILKLKSQNKALQQQLTNTLAAKFTELGVDTSQTITLSRDANGKVVVTNDHPDKEAIEKLFADTDVLTKAFGTLASNTTTLNSMSASQANSMLRTNGYAAYLNQLTSSGDSSDFYMSMLGNSSTIHSK